jgi:hypothetical protein
MPSPFVPSRPTTWSKCTRPDLPYRPDDTVLLSPGPLTSRNTPPDDLDDRPRPQEHVLMQKSPFTRRVCPEGWQLLVIRDFEYIRNIACRWLLFTIKSLCE